MFKYNLKKEQLYPAVVLYATAFSTLICSIATVMIIILDVELKFLQGTIQNKLFFLVFHSSIVFFSSIILFLLGIKCGSLRIEDMENHYVEINKKQWWCSTKIILANLPYIFLLVISGIMMLYCRNTVWGLIAGNGMLWNLCGLMLVSYQYIKKLSKKSLKKRLKK